MDGVVLPGLSARFEERPRNVSVRVGESVTLPCRIGDFDPATPLQVQWMKDGGMLGGIGDRALQGFPSYSIVGNQLNGEFHLRIDAVSLLPSEAQSDPHS